MPLPRLLMRLVDPANVYFDDRVRHRGGPVYRGGAVFGPDVPGGSRQATPEEIAEWRKISRHPREDAERHPIPAADSEVLSRAARELITMGTATLGQGAVNADVIRFWRGDSVLELTDAAGHRRSMTRIPRHLLSEHEALLSAYLAMYVNDE